MTVASDVAGETGSPASPADPAWGKDRGIIARKISPVVDRARHRGRARNGCEERAAQVGNAAENQKEDVAELICKLKSPDGVVRARAAAALRRLDPPPWVLLGAVFGVGDGDLQVAMMKVMRRTGRRTRAASR